MNVLREVLMRLRSEGQDGFRDVGSDGRYVGTACFVATTLPHVTPGELDGLMELAGIVPDPIVPNGSCGTCSHEDPAGGSRGWGMPCAGCAAPKLTRFHRESEGASRQSTKLGKSCRCAVCVEAGEVWTRVDRA